MSRALGFLPRSSRARWMVGVGIFALLVATGITTRVWYIRNVALPREGARNMLASLQIAVVDVDAWTRKYAAQAGLLARIAAGAPTLALPLSSAVAAGDAEGAADRASPALDAARRARFATEFGPTLRALDLHSGEVVDCWVWDEHGALLAGTSRAAPTVPDGPVRTSRLARGVAVDFAAPLMVDGVRRGTLALRVLPGDSTFSNLNPTARENVGGRTSLVARVGDSIFVVASQSWSPRRFQTRAFAAAAAPAYVRAAVAGVPQSGTGRGLAMDRVLYAATRINSLGWAVVREYDIDNLRGQFTSSIVIEESIFVVLAALAAAAAYAVARAARLRRAGALARVRADFVAGVSHELRTPLAQIRMFAELLRKDALREPGEADRALGIIEKEASRLSILVDNVLNFARLQRQAPSEVPRPADVADEARHVVDAFAPLAAERGVRTACDVPSGLRAAIDAQALRQVLINLLENAVKYGPRGQTVTLGARAEGARVSVWVDDEGPGIPEAERAAVFDAFHRGEDATRSDAPGSGLGLSVVRSLVEHHGGTVRAESAPRGGARMEVMLPRAGEGPGQ